MAIMKHITLHAKRRKKKPEVEENGLTTTTTNKQKPQNIITAKTPGLSSVPRTHVKVMESEGILLPDTYDALTLCYCPDVCWDHRSVYLQRVMLMRGIFSWPPS